MSGPVSATMTDSDQAVNFAAPSDRAARLAKTGSEAGDNLNSAVSCSNQLLKLVVCTAVGSGRSNLTTVGYGRGNNGGSPLGPA